MSKTTSNAFIQVDEQILVQMPSGNVKIVNLKADTTVNLGKFGSFNSDKLIGKPFGLSYEIYGENNDIRPVQHVAKNTSVEETEANNQLIIDDTTVQKLTQEEVLRLKAEGLKGTLNTEEIINKMVAAHSEFDKKTEFSKAKYIERKKKKFMKVFTPIRPSLYTITDYFFNKNPEKTKHLRIDTLSQLLSLSNVHANSKMLVVDDTQGLIVSAMLERMGGFGQLVAVHEGDFHNYDILRYMNFPKSVVETLYTVPFASVDPETPNDPFEILTEEQIEALDIHAKRSYLRRKSSYDYKTKSRQLLFDGDFDGLVISSNCTPESIIKELMKYVSGSRPIVVYSFSKELLLQAAYWMRRCPEFINADITESFLRQYQVLPGRMHPNMNTSAGGGYLLSAIRVIDCPFDMSLVKRDDSRRHKKKKTT
ncbi:hypothetical protein G6F57_006930 [Rhizopus arrhizus]|uniref:tRNA (adenine(58)-N(1))-methyltransferase non-catalytic subunit TRM6 n=1 Tax=Rhizopus oryzae TaxID=64495 RepID=A0A9P6X7I7_RHIOR|nr:hypothetical protein G6F23_004902 [Rhizopus arrhizus]KAG1415664.1 hypothetical protein G6F58_006377 [Rhizopus delemar]KAG0760052.1 hypothetical protein G6F24_008608 [Rhizopus arrhizus]KAG0786255.1 hypothetical protein G6F21_008720 [Rhizopus arrhizus]KAG0786638.1 hypothetical protein G6F22_007568 [Rhizopus arrhizus]